MYYAVTLLQNHTPELCGG